MRPSTEPELYDRPMLGVSPPGIEDSGMLYDQVNEPLFSEVDQDEALDRGVAL